MKWFRKSSLWKNWSGIIIINLRYLRIVAKKLILEFYLIFRAILKTVRIINIIIDEKDVSTIHHIWNKTPCSNFTGYWSQNRAVNGLHGFWREELFLHNQTILQDKKEEACFILLSFVFCSKQASFKHYFIQRSYDLKLTKRLLLIVFVGCVLFWWWGQVRTPCSISITLGSL